MGDGCGGASVGSDSLSSRVQTLIDLTSQLVDRGGIVMIPLLGLSVISVTLILERCWFWIRTNRPSALRRVARLIDLLAAGDARAEGLMAGDGTIYGAVARSLTRRSPTQSTALSAVEAVRPRLERWMVTLSTIITAAPLLGILGTVLGIIQSFNLLGQDQTLAEPSQVSAGIAEALLTTAAGLVVALVTLFPYMIFKGQVDRTLGRLESLIAAAMEQAGTQSSAPVSHERPIGQASRLPSSDPAVQASPPETAHHPSRTTGRAAASGASG